MPQQAMYTILIVDDNPKNLFGFISNRKNFDSRMKA